MVTAKPEVYPFDNWFIPFTTGMSVNWPYEDRGCLLWTENEQEATVNPIFVQHIMRLDNWSVGPMFNETHAELACNAIVREKPPPPVTHFGSAPVDDRTQAEQRS